MRHRGRGGAGRPRPAIDVLVNNAGITRDMTFKWLAEEWTRSTGTR
jgi:short-subunit dehydrogenase involved in D-alanine esterification of teichoic acids